MEKLSYERWCPYNGRAELTSRYKTSQVTNTIPPALTMHQNLVPLGVNGRFKMLEVLSWAVFHFEPSKMKIWKTQFMCQTEGLTQWREIGYIS